MCLGGLPVAAALVGPSCSGSLSFVWGLQTLQRQSLPPEGPLLGAFPQTSLLPLHTTTVGEMGQVRGIMAFIFSQHQNAKDHGCTNQSNLYTAYLLYKDIQTVIKTGIYCLLFIHIFSHVMETSYRVYLLLIYKWWHMGTIFWTMLLGTHFWQDDHLPSDEKKVSRKTMLLNIKENIKALEDQYSGALHCSIAETSGHVCHHPQGSFVKGTEMWSCTFMAVSLSSRGFRYTGTGRFLLSACPPLVAWDKGRDRKSYCG